MKHLFIAAGLWLTVFCTQAQVFHTIDGGDVWFFDGVITGYRDYHTNIVIPAYINGKQVLAIGDEAFEREQLTSVIMANSIKYIGANAFSNNNLTSIDIPSSVRVIGNEAFTGNSLTEVKIPKSVIKIGQGAFAGNEMTTFTLRSPREEGTWNTGRPKESVSVDQGYVYTVDGYQVQEKDLNTQANAIIDYYGPAGGIIIPEEVVGNSILQIQEAAFRGKGLTAVTIPSTVQEIERNAFRANKLSEIDVPNSVTKIGVNAFEANNFSTFILPTPDFEGSWNDEYDSGSEVAVGREYEYTATDDSAEEEEFVFEDGVISAYNGSSRRVVIPDSISGQPVTKIGERAFRAKRLRAVTIPNSVTHIESSAFSGNDLRRVTLPTSLVIIGSAAFSSNELNEVVIPNSVTHIGQSAFANNLNIARLEIPNSVVEIGESAFRNNRIEAVTIPNSVKRIGDSAFERNSLKNLTIPSSVTEIEPEAFSENDLMSVTIPSSVKHIGQSAFSDNSLTSLTIPNSVIRIESRAFEGNDLTGVTIPNSVFYIGVFAFYRNDFVSLVLPVHEQEGKWTNGNAGEEVRVDEYQEYVYNLDRYEAQDNDFRFEDGVILEYFGPSGTVILPSSIGGQPVVEIGDRAFRFYGGLEEVVIPSSVKSIGDEAFREGDLKRVTIPNSVTHIGDMAFDSNELERLNIPNSVVYIGESAFFSNQIERLTMSNTIEFIGDRAFARNLLTDIKLPNSLKSIEPRVFAQNSIVNLELPNSVTSIGFEAFYTNNLEKLVIPNSVTLIEPRAFSGNDLETVSIPNAVTHIGYWAFYGNELNQLTLPSSLIHIGASAFRFNNLEEVTIPNTVTYIGREAFDGNELESFVLPSPSADGLVLGKWITRDVDPYTSRIGPNDGIFYEAGVETTDVESAYLVAPQENNLVLVSAKLEGENVNLKVKGDQKRIYENVSYVDFLVEKGSKVVLVPKAPVREGFVYSPKRVKFKDISKSKSQEFIYKLKEVESVPEESEAIKESSGELTPETLPMTWAYPNPSITGTFHLDIPNATHLKVYDAQRTVVYEAELVGGKAKVDLSEPGIYYLQVYVGGNRYAQKLQVR